MALSTLKGGVANAAPARAPRRNVMSVLALLSFVALFLVTLSVLSNNQQQRSPFEEVNDVDFDNADEVTDFLTSKARQSATGDQFL